MKRIKIKIRSNSLTKLVFVKLVKDTTGLGLKEAKDLVDQACDNYLNQYPTTEIEFSSEQSLHKFRSEINNIGFAQETPIV